MGYKMIEITQEKKGELMEHAEKAYEHLGKMIECVEGMGEGSMGMRGDEWYIRKMGMRGGGYGSRYGMRGMRDDEMEDEDNYGMRYGMRRGRYGNRDPYFY